MSLSAAVIDALVASGVSAEQLAAAMKAELAEQEARKASKRAGNAERQRRFKAKRKAESGNTDNALPAITEREQALLKEIPPDPHKKIYPPVCADAQTAPKGRANDRGSKIPEDWQPPAISELSPEAQTLAKQWPTAAYRAEAEAFRNFWLAETGARARKSSWNRAWCNRIVQVHPQVMRAAKFAPAERSAKVTPIRPESPEDHEKMARWYAERDRHEEAAAERAKAAQIRNRGPTSIGALAKAMTVDPAILPQRR